MLVSELANNGFTLLSEIYNDHEIIKSSLFKDILFIDETSLFAKKIDFNCKTVMFFKQIPDSFIVNSLKERKINVIYSDLFLNDFSLHFLDLANNSIKNKAKFLKCSIKIKKNFITFKLFDNLKAKKKFFNIKNNQGLGIPLFYLMCKLNDGFLRVTLNKKRKIKARFKKDYVSFNDFYKTLYVIFNSTISFDISVINKNKKEMISLDSKKLLEKYETLNNKDFLEFLKENKTLGGLNENS